MLRGDLRQFKSYMKVRRCLIKNVRFARQRMTNVGDIVVSRKLLFGETMLPVQSFVFLSFGDYTINKNKKLPQFLDLFSDFCFIPLPSC